MSRTLAQRRSVSLSHTGFCYASPQGVAATGPPAVSAGYPRDGGGPRPLSPSRPLSPAPSLDSAAAGDWTDALGEFDAVLADFASPCRERHFHYEEHLERMKRRSSASVSDSCSFSDSESECFAPREGACGPGDAREGARWAGVSGCVSANRAVGAQAGRP